MSEEVNKSRERYQAKLRLVLKKYPELGMNWFIPEGTLDNIIELDGLREEPIRQ